MVILSLLSEYKFRWLAFGLLQLFPVLCCFSCWFRYTRKSILIIYCRSSYRVCIIIYFSHNARIFLFTGLNSQSTGRTFATLLTVRRAWIFCCRGGLWHFIELEGISVGIDQIALVDQLFELIVIGSPCHADGSADRLRGQGKLIIVGVGCQI